MDRKRQNNVNNELQNYKERERKGEVRSRWYCGANGSHWGERDNLECILLDSYNWGSFNRNLRFVVFVNFISHCFLMNMCCFNNILSIKWCNAKCRNLVSFSDIINQFCVLQQLCIYCLCLKITLHTFYDDFYMITRTK